ncbi:MAG: exodeoxyribonuclease III [Bacteroidia bacterium]|nr:exodeoxyribonuclease III [Bacteroidia bacterium]
MKIISYNLNGIRAAIRKGFIDWLKATDADVVCLQEVKADASQIPPSLFEDMGYYVYWHAAERKGYSGVAILTRIKPQTAVLGYESETGLSDPEGRLLRLDFEDYSVMTVYIPSGSSGGLRQDFKVQWLDQFYEYIKNLLTYRPRLLISGDYNICHQAIDIHNPKANARSSGFLPEERAWLTRFMNLGLLDTFRYFNPEPHHYTWWSTRMDARDRNLGWRIDYHLLTENLQANLKRALILSEAKHSDHCPVLVEIA